MSILLADAWQGRMGNLVMLIHSHWSGVYRINHDGVVWAGTLPLVSLESLPGELAPLSRSRLLHVIALSAPTELPLACQRHKTNKRKHRYVV